MMVRVLHTATRPGLQFAQDPRQRPNETWLSLLIRDEHPTTARWEEFRKAASDGTGRSVHAGVAVVRQGWLVKLGHVAIDGTKIRQAPSKHKAMSTAHERDWQRLKQESKLC